MKRHLVLVAVFVGMPVLAACGDDEIEDALLRLRAGIAAQHAGEDPTGEAAATEVAVDEPAASPVTPEAPSTVPTSRAATSSKPSKSPAVGSPSRSGGAKPARKGRPSAEALASIRRAMPKIQSCFERR